MELLKIAGLVLAVIFLASIVLELLKGIVGFAVRLFLVLLILAGAWLLYTVFIE